MKKLILLTLVLILSVPLNTVFADSFNLVIDNKTATAGETVEINLSLENNSGLIAARFNIEYDKQRLTLTDSKDKSLLQGGVFSQTIDAYPYIMLWNSAASSNFTSDGILATLTFKVLDNAPAGNAYINLTYNADDVFDVNLNNVSLNVINGNIDVKSANRPTGGGGSLRGGSFKPTPTPSVDNDIVKKQIILTIDKKEASVFGEAVTNDVAPVIRNDRTMLPGRFVAENLGATVLWNSESKTVTINKDKTEIIIILNSSVAYVNGEAITLDSPAFSENDRTYTPLRFIAENLGADVLWTKGSMDIVITKQ